VIYTGLVALLAAGSIAALPALDSAPSGSSPGVVTVAALLLASVITVLAARRAGQVNRGVGDDAAKLIDDTWVFAGALLLNPYGLMAVVMVTVLIESTLNTRSGRTMRTVFNLAAVWLAALAALFTFTALTDASTNGWVYVGAAITAGLVYLTVDKVLTVAMLTLLAGRPWRIDRANLFHGLAVEATLISHAIFLAWLWTVSPWTALLGVPTLVLLQQSLMHDDLRRRASTDAKTGAAAAGWWRDTASESLAAAREADQSTAVLVCDLDHFKRVNDTFGHLSGDEVLRDVADVLISATSHVPGSLVGRFGGEEFVILLPGMNTIEATAVAERVRAAIDEHSFLPAHEQGPLHATVSIGVASSPEHGIAVPAVLEAADRGVYAAKHGGRNQVATPDRAAAPDSPADLDEDVSA
jgi:diguanylate cyclase (GGDEF)-like protein